MSLVLSRILAAVSCLVLAAQPAAAQSIAANEHGVAAFKIGFSYGMGAAILFFLTGMLFAPIGLWSPRHLRPRIPGTSIRVRIPFGLAYGVPAALSLALIDSSYIFGELQTTLPAQGAPAQEWSTHILYSVINENIALGAQILLIPMIAAGFLRPLTVVWSWLLSRVRNACAAVLVSLPDWIWIPYKQALLERLSGPTGTLRDEPGVKDCSRLTGHTERKKRHFRP